MLSFKTSENADRRPTKRFLVGKIWFKASGSMRIANMSQKVEGKKDVYEDSSIYPYIVSPVHGYHTIGENTSPKRTEKHNTHWLFLNIYLDEVDSYVKELAKIGQVVELDEDEGSAKK